MNKFGTEKIRKLENFLETDSFRQLEWVGDEDLDFEKAIGEFFIGIIKISKFAIQLWVRK